MTLSRLAGEGVRCAAVAFALLLGAATPAAAQDWSAATVETVELSNFDYAPRTIRLRAGHPVTLRLRNVSGGGHNFAARDFFAVARVQPGSAARIRRGAVEVRSRSTVDIALVPAAGRYRLRCTHTLHSAFGMTGEIVVE